MNDRILVIDNRDSFTWNLVDELSQLGAVVEVRRNDQPLELLQARARASVALVLSPGPGAPAQAGNLLPLLRSGLGQVPVLGICLGHQALVEALGGTIGRASAPRHGQASPVHHDGHALFDGVASPFNAGRYHSLIATALPDALAAIAHTADGTVMAVVGRELPLLGLQFHPESILTPSGRTLLRNALAWLAAVPRLERVA